MVILPVRINNDTDNSTIPVLSLISEYAHKTYQRIEAWLMSGILQTVLRKCVMCVQCN